MERKCKTCAWWDDKQGDEQSLDSGDCCWDNIGRAKRAFEWCRYWSKTTGWEEGTEQAQRLADYLEDHKPANG